MADLTITVSAPGSTSAASEIKGARTETEKAAKAVDALKKATEAATRASGSFEDAVQEESRRLQDLERRTKAVGEARKRLATRGQLFGERGAGAPPLSVDWTGKAALAARRSADFSAIKAANSPAAMGLTAGGPLFLRGSSAGGGPSIGGPGSASGVGFSKLAGKLGSSVSGVLGGVGERFGFLSTLGPAAVAAGAGLAVHGAVTNLAVASMERHKESLERSANAVAQWTQINKDTAKLQQQQGMDAAQSQGATLTALTARGHGLLDKANEVTARGWSATDAQQATLTLSNRGTKTIDSDLRNAELLARVSGTSLSEAAGGLSDFSVRDRKAVAAVLGEREGRQVSGIDLNMREEWLSGNRLTDSVRRINANAGKTDLVGQGQITTAGVLGSDKALFAAQDPTAAANLAVFTDMSAKLDVLRSIDRGVVSGERLLDRLVNGKNSAQGKLAAAVDEQAAFGAAQ